MCEGGLSRCLVALLSKYLMNVVSVNIQRITIKKLCNKKARDLFSAVSFLPLTYEMSTEIYIFLHCRTCGNCFVTLLLQ